MTIAHNHVVAKMPGGVSHAALTHALDNPDCVDSPQIVGDRSKPDPTVEGILEHGDIVRFKGTPFLRVLAIDVTPALAAEWLTRNYELNRHCPPSSYEKITESMRDGAWKLTHQGIAFDGLGRLVDGQHRLLAVVKSGVTAPMFVSVYLGEAPMEVFDRGQTRKVGHALEVRGLVAKGRGQNIASSVVSMLNGVRWRHSEIPESEIFLAYRTHADSLNWALSALGSASPFTAPVRAAFAWAYPVNPMVVATFARRLVTMADIAPGSPEQVILQWLTGERGKTAKKNRGTQEERNNMFARTLSGIQMAILGQSGRKIQAPSGDTVPQVVAWFKAARQGAGHVALIPGED